MRQVCCVGGMASIWRISTAKRRDIYGRTLKPSEMKLRLEYYEQCIRSTMKGSKRMVPLLDWRASLLTMLDFKEEPECQTNC